MEAYLDLIERIIVESDLVLEVLDARLIEMSRNEEVERLVKEVGRPMIFVINKIDLVDRKNIVSHIDDLKKIGEVVFVSAKRPKDVRVLLYAIKRVFKKFGKRKKILRKVGDAKVKIREAKGDIVVGILGYPNVGKSSIINALAHKKKVKVSKKAGTTHGIHWIKVTNEIKLIDSPGIIPLSGMDDIKYGLIGAKTDKLKNVEIVAHEIIKLFLKNGKKNFEKFYNIKMTSDVDNVIDQIGKMKNFLLKGGKIDEHRVFTEIIRDWQVGRLKF